MDKTKVQRKFQGANQKEPCNKKHGNENSNVPDAANCHVNVSMKMNPQSPQQSSSDITYQMPAYNFRRFIYQESLDCLNQMTESSASNGNQNTSKRERGGYDPPSFPNVQFEEEMIRKKFVAKVYSILTLQFLVTLGFIWLFTSNDVIQEFAYDNWWISFIFLGVFMITYIVLVCVENARRSFPVNILLLGLLTVSQSMMAGILSSAYDTIIVLYAIGITTVIFISVTLIARFAPFDVTGCGMVCCALSLGLCIFGTVCTVIMIFARIPILHLVYSGIAVVVFTLYILYDTQMIMGGRRIELSPEEYILASVQLYVDVVQIFYNVMLLVAACFED